MTHNVVVKRSAACTNVDSYNRTAIATIDLDNGSVFRLTNQSTAKGKEEVWVAVAGTSADVVPNGYWMAHTPEHNTTKDGDLKFRGLTVDPRLFYNEANEPFDAKYLAVGDIYSMTGEGVTDIATKDYLISDDGSFNLIAATSVEAQALITAGKGLVLRKVAGDKIPIGGSPMLGGMGVASFKYEIVFNA